MLPLKSPPRLPLRAFWPLVPILTGLLATGCASPEPAVRPDWSLAPTWAEPTDTGRPTREVSATWWKSFGSPRLEALIDEAERGNTDLRVALERVRQAELALQQAGTSRWPTVGSSAGLSTSRSKAGDEPGASRESTSLGLSVSYEVDLWGRIAAGVSASESSLQATRLDVETARASLRAGVATSYFTWLATGERLRLARENLAIAQRVLRIVEARHRHGVATSLEVSQQRLTVLSQQTALLPLEVQQRQTASALALLLGRMPQQPPPLSGETLEQMRVPHPAPDLPATLLTRRPDLAAAEARLAAADANITATRAALLPSVSLSSSASLGSSVLLSLADPTRSVSVGLGLAQSLFDAGKRRLAVDTSLSQRQVLIETYAASVRTALKEVEDSLGNAERGRRQEAAQREIVEQAQRALRLAELRYREGAGDLLSVLEAQRTLFSGQDALATQRQSRLSSAVDLYQALGGGWSPDRRVPL